MRCIKRGGAAPPAAQAVSHTAWRAWSMPWSPLPLSFAAGPGRSPAGRAQVWSPRLPSTAPCSVKAKGLWSSTPWAKFPDPIGPRSGSTRHPVRCSEVVSWTTRTVLCSKHCWAVSLVRPCGKAAGCTRGLARKRETPLACPQRPAACGMASLGRSANVSQMEAKRAERRVSGNTVPAATRAAQSVCVCIEHPLLGIKVCCQRLLSYYLLSASWAVPTSSQKLWVMLRLAVGGAGVLMGLFVVCWCAVQSLHLPDMTAVFYGHGASPPTPVLWMNLVRGGGIVYI